MVVSVGAVVTAALVVGAVAEAGAVVGNGAATGSGGAGASGTPLSAQFADAAREFHVPLNVLMAVSYQETRWDSHHGQPSATGNYNVMGLTKVDPGDVKQPSASGLAAESAEAAGDDYRIRHIKHPSQRTPRDQAVTPTVNTADPTLHTLDAAASLIHEPTGALKTDTEQSIRGGAALLAQYEKSLTGGLPTDPGQWFPAVARYSQSPDTKGAQLFATRVFATIRTGMSRLTADGQQVVLPASSSVTPQGRTATTGSTGTTGTTATTGATPSSFATVTTPTADCPTSLSCQYVPAAYALSDPTDPTSYGNYDVANRPADGIAIRYIVIHDTEASYSSTINSFSALDDPEASAQYVIRSSDGQVTQMVSNTDEAIHAGNKYVNVHSIGVEHEGYAISGASWYTESQYESSAALVKYLAQKYGIPLDRQHIIGHDDVPGPIDSYVAGMHWDPGTFWDWNHYMALLGAPVPSNPAGAPLVAGEAVTVSIPFTTANEPTVTNCPTCAAIPAQPANFVYLRTSPSSSAPLLGDPYLHGTAAGTTEAADWGDKLVTGESFVVAAQQGDWTAIWYGGVKAWFYNPAGSFTAPAPAGTTVVTTAAGATSAPVYGRAYPETSAYPADLATVAASSTQQLTPLTQYTFPAGQEYVADVPVAGDFYYTMNINGDAPDDRTDVVGTTTYREIRYNHRIAFVNAADVRTSATTAPPAASKRWNLLGRDTGGGLWQYQGTGNPAAQLLSRYRVGGGWQAFNMIVPLDGMRADAQSSLVARDGNGVLWLYQGTGNAAAPFKPAVKVGGGWQAFNAIVGVGDVTGDGHADLVVRNASGVLYLYQGTGNAAAPFKPAVHVGSGWQVFNAIVGVGDVTGDGHADLVVRNASGVLYLYQGTGNAAAPFKAAVRVGTGWQTYKTIIGARDLNGDGKPDLIGIDANGVLWNHPGTGNAAAAFGARVQIGVGWGGFSTVV
ncbi:N-acetylmuramoyl-L-alanine amidase [Streptacidiphilus melanogenes]|uniref:N-acetylmuramoyl-L-alanine amidase n=1 Tax=Streptacidiphilus melanogenes TaxID=411235 RepID=UPI000A7ABBB9|nr:N-acetylmuramoyl-L-alanine amidase [Streptacidiphilus melanogenes]